MIQRLSFSLSMLLITFVSLTIVRPVAAQQSLAARDLLVEDLEIRGNRRVQREEILKYVQSQPGERYNAEQVRRDFEAILGLGLFDPLKTKLLEHNGPRGGKIIIFQVSEFPDPDADQTSAPTDSGQTSVSPPGQEGVIYQKTGSQAMAEGVKFLTAGELQQAAESFKQAIEAAPKNARAHYLLGLSLSKLGRSSEALTAYQQASRLDPADLAAHYELGKVYLASGDPPAAVEKYRLLEGKDRSLAGYLYGLFSKEQISSYQIPAPEGMSVGESLDQAARPDAQIFQAGREGAGKPVITYRERASYTEIARRNYVSGVVVLSAIFTKEGRIGSIRVLRRLPDGLTQQAIKAAQLIRFEPATRNGEPVDVRLQIEYDFAIY